MFRVDSINRYHFLMRTLAWLMIALCLISIYVIYFSDKANAIWNSGVPLAKESIGSLYDDPGDTLPRGCKKQFVYYGNKQYTSCVNSIGRLSYMRGDAGATTVPNKLGIIVDITGSGRFIPISEPSAKYQFGFFADSNTLILFSNKYREAYVVKNFTDHLTLKHSVDTYAHPYYELTNVDSSPIMKFPDIWEYSLGGVSRVANDWWYFDVSYLGMFRLNVFTYEVQYVFHAINDTTVDTWDAYVSADASTIVMKTEGGYGHVVEVDDMCITSLGIKPTLTVAQLWNQSTSCKKRDINLSFSKEADKLIKIWDISEDGAELYGFERNYAADTLNWFKVKPNVSGLPSLDYLALGDSYSSGEGDIGKKDDGSSYYRAGTDGGRDTCHISERSYPYELAKINRTNRSSIASVACSGAEVMKDYFGDSSGYQGQGNRLDHLDSSQLSQAHAQAIASDTPGRVKQIEFVKKYKPRVMTLTAGGNDIGFADILEYCASGYTKLQVAYTCGYAQPGELRKMLASSIHTQFIYTKMMIQAMQAASPNTKIYIVGYPSFTKTNSETCVNSGIMNTAERRMINESVVYMNSVLRSVAKATGSIYLHIEDSLVGGRLCEGSEYMTGPLNVGLREDSNMFHPNAKGHQQIANSITRSGLFNLNPKPNSLQPDTSVTSPAIPEYFNSYSVSDGLAYSRTMLSDPSLDQAIIIVNGVKTAVGALKDVIRAGMNVAISMPQFSFGPNTLVKFKAYSEETTIGEFQASSNGSLTTNIDLNLEPGHHTIVAEGTTVEGAKVKYYQFVTVIGSNMQDIDNDGIENQKDMCNFIQWYDEKTGEDACVIKSSSASVASQNSVRNSNKNEYTKTTEMDRIERHTTDIGVAFGEMSPIINNSTIRANVSPVLIDKNDGKERGLYWYIASGLILLSGILLAIRKHNYVK